VGYQALNVNVAGTHNTAVGFDTLAFNTAAFNTAVGASALLSNTTGADNTAVGSEALDANTTGELNTAVGSVALGANTIGDSNTAVGNSALNSNTTGSQNTAVGSVALGTNTTGIDNTAVGYQAGLFLTGDDNICIGAGVTGAGGVSNNIRIGIPVDGVGQTFIAGIRGVAVVGDAVLVTAAGQLGTLASSLRYKQDIEDMGDLTDDLIKLRPVTFRYKPEIEPSGSTQYGLIAEEVAEVYPDLVVYKDGQPETVKYHVLGNLLLNEVKKLMLSEKVQNEQIALMLHRIGDLESKSSAA
ncbi:MAG: tail fiber domain-containing protein, partial [bacterium]|nr:tail fiber domain-containing protein [bacterium]